MIRKTFVMRRGHLVSKRRAKPLIIKSEAAHVIGDVMEPTRHMGTGRIYDSKSRFRADTRAMGCVEVGTDPAIYRESPRAQITKADIVADVKRSIEQLRSR